MGWEGEWDLPSSLYWTSTTVWRRYSRVRYHDDVLWYPWQPCVFQVGTTRGFPCCGAITQQTWLRWLLTSLLITTSREGTTWPWNWLWGNFCQLGNFFINFCGILPYSTYISWVFNFANLANLEFIKLKFEPLRCHVHGQHVSAKFFNEFLQNSYSQKFRPAKYEHYNNIMVLFLRMLWRTRNLTTWMKTWRPLSPNWHLSPTTRTPKSLSPLVRWAWLVVTMVMIVCYRGDMMNFCRCWYRLMNLRMNSATTK